MTCSEVSALVALHLSGELDRPRASEFGAHLENCPACAQEVSSQAACDGDLRSCVLAETVATAALEKRVMRRIGLQNRRRRFVFAAAAAVALSVAIGGAALFRGRAPDVYAAAARDHHSEILDRQPRRWRTDLASIEELAQRQGISISAISAVPPAGYRLKEGKLCRLDGRLFLHLVYTDGVKTFSVFLRSDAETAGTGKRISEAHVGGEHVAGFRTGSLDAIVVTSQPGNAAALFAKSAAAAI